MNQADDEDDVPQLSGAALQALAEFMKEREEAEAMFKKLQAAAEDRWALGMKPFPEDYQLSQFWYSDQTATDLAQLILQHTTPVDRIAFVSTPTAFVKYMSMSPPNTALLFEFDKRFASHGDSFVYYDYRSPLNLPASVQANSFSFVLLDPPFLSEECFEKTAETVRYLAAKDAKIVACTGAVMRDAVKNHLGLRLCQYRPQHQSNLSNEFRCYSNFESSFGFES